MVTKFRDEKVVIFLTYELVGLTILRCARCSTDRRANCVAKTDCVALSMTYRKPWIAKNQSQAVGSLKFHNWMPLKALGRRFDTLSFKSREDTRKRVLQLRGLMIWTEKTILILKDSCNVSAVVQYTSHSLTRASWVTVHTWTCDVGRKCSAGEHLLRCLQFVPWYRWGRSWSSLSARALGSDDNTHLCVWCVVKALASVPIPGLLNCP